MKKLIALITSLVMLLSLTACGNSGSTGTEETAETAVATEATTETAAVETTETAQATEVAAVLDKSWPEETVKIGFECFDTTDEQFLAIQEYYEYLAQSYNFEMVYSESIQSPEDELKFIENCASAGCKAIIGYYNVSEGQAVQLAADKGMYYWGGADKASIYDKFVDSEYYLGGYDGGNSNYESGYAMAEALIEAGCKKLVYTSGGRDFGIDFFIDRSEGFYAAVEEAKKTDASIEVVYDVSGWPGTDAFAADQTKVCDMEVDGIGNSFSALVWAQPLSAAGKFDKVKMTTIGNTNDAYKDLMAAGSIIAIMYENEEVQFGGAIPSILNAVAGDSDVVRNEGKAANYSVARWQISNSEQFDAIYEKHSNGEYYVTAEEVSQMIKQFNPSADYKTMADLYGAKTMLIIEE